MVLLDYNKIMKKRMAPDLTEGYFDTMMDNVS
jgi:hypothetical protein